MQYDFNLRQKCIIHYLSSRSDYCSGDELASVAHVSARTIRKEIKDINLLLDKLDDSDRFVIESVHSKGYRFKVMDRTAFESFIHDLDYDATALERRLWEFLEHQIRLLAVMVDHLDLDTLSEIIHYSESVIRPVIRNIKSGKDPRERLTVVLEGNNLYPQGEEYFIRIRALDVIFIDPSYAGVSQNALAILRNPGFESQVRACIINEFVQENTYSIGELAIEYALQFLWVSHVRNNMGYFMSLPEKDIDLIREYTELNGCAFRVIERIHKNTSYRFTREDAYVLALIFASVCEFKDPKGIRLDEKSQELCDRTASFIIKDLLLDESNKGYVSEVLSPFFYAFHLRNHFRIARQYMGLTRVKRKMISRVEYSRHLSREIGRYSEYAVGEKEIVYLGLCVASIWRLFNSRRGQKILVSSKYGLAEGRRFAISLQKAYGAYNIADIKAVETYEIEKYWQDFDLVLVDDSQKKDMGGKDHAVRVYPEYAKANTLPSNIIYDIRRLKDRFYFMNQIREDSFVSMDVDTPEDVYACIEQMAGRMYGVKAPLRQFLAEEDRRLTYECGYRMALIHVRREEIDGSQIRIGILQKPIVWRKRLVQIVIMIFTGEDYHALWQYEHGLRVLMQTASNSSLLVNKPNVETLQRIFEEGAE